MRLLLAVISFLLLRLPTAVAVRKTRLTWVNGIAHNLEHMEEGKVLISNIFGGKRVDYCFNPTAMSTEEDMFGYAADLTQATTQKLGRITAEVNELVKHLKDAVSKVGKKGKVIHIAHSQGALVTSLAAKQLTPLEMSQIEVLTFGGAAALRKTPRTPFHRVVNYYSVNDPLLLVVPAAAHALKSGFVGDDEFCFLAPRIGDPIRDHNLLGPTYAQALMWEGQRFRSQYQGLVYRSSRTSALFTMALLNALSLRLHLILRAVLRPILHLLLYVYNTLQPLNAALRACLKTYFIKPALVAVLVLYLWIRDMVRKGEEQYQPAQVAIDLADKKLMGKTMVDPVSEQVP